MPLSLPLSVNQSACIGVDGEEIDNTQIYQRKPAHCTDSLVVPFSNLRKTHNQSHFLQSLQSSDMVSTFIQWVPMGQFKKS